MTLTDEDRALIERTLTGPLESRYVSDNVMEFFESELAALLSAARQARTQGPGEGWEVLADELRKPQFMTTTSGGRKHTLEFTFHGEEGREARDRLHDAILLAARDEGRAEGLGGEWRPEVVAFANIMEAKLQENDHKGGWKTDDAEDLFVRLGEECVELSEAIGLWRIQDDWRSAALHLLACRKNVAREAADVANFAMMIADVCGALPAPPASLIKEGRVSERINALIVELTAAIRDEVATIPENVKTLGEEISEARARSRLSLQDVADASGFAKSHVWELEHGRSRNPTVAMVAGLSAALGVPFLRLAQAALNTQRIPQGDRHD